MYDSSWVRYRVLTATSAAPTCDAAGCTVTQEGRFPSRTVTRSPGPTPELDSPWASASASANNAL